MGSVNIMGDTDSLSILRGKDLIKFVASRAPVKLTG